MSHSVKPSSKGKAPEKAILVGLRLKRLPRWEVEEHLEELGRLAQTAGAEVVFATTQERDRPHPGTLIGEGKVEELAQLAESLGAEVIIFDDSLSPAQQRNLENATKRKIMDRAGLILDIFAQRALTAEGRLQVELAQYQYLLPRLTRMWTHLHRLGGGIGTRGPGETQLEADRRRITARVAQLKKELDKVAMRRRLMREGRKKGGLPTVALVGYTNAGKSTLLNTLCGGKEALADDRLFATLDPTVRRLRLPSGLTVLVSDTVGFIRKLPHQLVAAFKSTLEQARDADLILHVVDASSDHRETQMGVVEEVLEDLELGDKPRWTVYNKMDQVLSEGLRERLEGEPGTMAISAATGEGIPDLKARLEEFLDPRPWEVWLAVPLKEEKLLAEFKAKGRVWEQFERADEVFVHGAVPARLTPRFRPCFISPEDFLAASGEATPKGGG